MNDEWKKYVLAQMMRDSASCHSLGFVKGFKVRCLSYACIMTAFMFMSISEDGVRVGDGE